MHQKNTKKFSNEQLERLYFGEIPEKIELGVFGEINIWVIYDKVGRVWFPQKELKKAIKKTQPTLSKTRKSHPEHFPEWEAWCKIRFESSRLMFFSEFGLDSLARYSRDSLIYDFKMWVNRSLRYRQGTQSLEEILEEQKLPGEDWTDLSFNHRRLQECLNVEAMACFRLQELQKQEHYLRRELAKQEQILDSLEGFQNDRYGFVDFREYERPISDVARQARWWNSEGAPHITAVLIFVLNAEYDVRGWVREEDDLWIFTEPGLREFFFSQRDKVGRIGPLHPSERVQELYGLTGTRWAFKL